MIAVAVILYHAKDITILTKKTVRFAVVFTTAVLLFYAILFVKVDRQTDLKVYVQGKKLHQQNSLKQKLGRIIRILWITGGL
jgi:hypothetical protein